MPTQVHKSGINTHVATDHVPVDVFFVRFVYGTAKNNSTQMIADTSATLLRVNSIDFFEPYSFDHQLHQIPNHIHHFGLMSMTHHINTIQDTTASEKRSVCIINL